MKKLFNTSRTILAALALTIGSAWFISAQPDFGQLYYEGGVVRTVVPPAAMKKEGSDNLYLVPDQMAVAAVAPGDTDYHGGKWAVYVVDWTVPPYPLTSEAEVLEAEAAGDVVVTRAPERDFKCPVQP